MEQIEQVLRKLEIMNSKIDSLGSNVAAIDVSITGDPKRGVLGIKQHIEEMQQDFHKHVKDDAILFDAIHKNQEKVQGKFTTIKGWIAGASFIIVGITSTVVFVVNIYFQLKK